MTTTRLLGGSSSFKEHIYRIIAKIFSLNYNEYDYGLNIKQAIKTNFVEYGIELPFKIIKIFVFYSDLTIFIMSFILILIIFIYIYGITKRNNLVLLKIKAGKIMLIGLILFACGYSAFLLTTDIAFTTTGIGNRVTIGAAIGIAIIFVGLITGISRLIKRERFRNIFFSLSIAALCFTGFLIINTISVYWVKAYQSENAALKEIKSHLPALPDSTRFMLDGICPYIGPAIVFESHWDLIGAIRIAYSNKSLEADVISNDLQITDEGFVTSIYNYKMFYPYDILIYNYLEKKTYRISNKEQALKYFNSAISNYSNTCPLAHEGHGVEIF